MSVQATAWVIERSKQKGSHLLLLIMIANHAHADGTGAYPAIGTLARECRMSERQIKRMLPELEASGELIVFWSKGRKPHDYAIRMGNINRDILSLLETEYRERMDELNRDILSPLTVTSCHGSDDSTVTNPALNSDISDTSTVTNSTKKSMHKNKGFKPSLEKNSEKKKEENDITAKKSEKRSEKQKTRPDLEDQDWIEHLKVQDDNRGIDIAALFDRMLAWCAKKRVTPSRLRLLNWLDREREAVPVSFNPPAKSTPLVETRFIPKPQRPPASVPVEQTHAWNAFRDDIHKRVSQQVFDSHFKPLIFDGINEDRNKFKVRTLAVTHDWIKRYYGEPIYESFVSIGMAEFSIEWEVEVDEYEELEVA